MPHDNDLYDEDKHEDIVDIGKQDDLLLNGDIANEAKQVNHFGDYQHENQ